ncbi:ATP-binding protein [Pseudomonas sp. PAMC 25886]|jgi:two-component system sensor histidine kinase EvgS|uniref:ATP-binding protein n=1 Tax=Pseudomonas sp. PAMC 25886 TaxID=1125977 RepID=UPI000287E988|nr:ATP-binding protein [Pseudomonas sp. PAMC 25886]
MKAAKTIVAALLIAGVPLLARAEPHIAGTPDFELDMVVRTQGQSTLYWGMALAGLGSILCWNLGVLLWRRKADDPRRVLATFVANMREMIDNVPRPVFIRDHEGRLVACNNSYLDFLAMDLNQVLGKPITELQLMPLSESRQYHEHYLRVVREGVPLIGSGSLVAPYGETLALFYWIFPCFNARGRAVGVIAGWVDVSDREQLMIQLKASQKEADDANNAKTLFLATMSHEIRTPMNAVLGMLEMASKRAEQGIIDRVSLDIASSAANSLVDLLGDILDIVRIESGQLTLAPKRANLYDEVLKVARIFDGVAQQKFLELQIDLDPQADCEVLVDAMRVKQVLSNLLSNAIKFTVRGQVRFFLRCTPVVDGSELDLTLSVIDTGIGISPEDQALLFSPFTQVGQPAEAMRTGSGLGLAISRTLCEMMGGRLTLSSELGRGTRIDVSLRLPVLENLAPTTHDSVSPVLRAKRLSVLVVDDYPANRLLLSQQLTYLGHDVADAEDGAHGLRAWRQGTYDVVITDSHMPIMNGYELSRAIRDEEQRKGSKPCVIVGLTANAQPEEKQRCLNAGMDDCLFKPIRLRELSARMSIIEPLAHPHEAPLAMVGQGINLDLTSLIQLARGDEDSVSTITKNLALSLEEDMCVLMQCYANMDIEGLATLAHRIKGGGRIVGAQNVLIRCAQLETACEEAEPGEVTAATLALEQAMLALKAALIALP